MTHFKTSPPSTPLLDLVKQRLRAELPEYMVPLHWAWLKQLPLNANGKLDRKTLQLNVPLRAMFERSTVEELASYVEGLKASELSDDKVDRLSDLMAELEAL